MVDLNYGYGVRISPDKTIATGSDFLPNGGISNWEFRKDGFFKQFVGSVFFNNVSSPVPASPTLLIFNLRALRITEPRPRWEN